MSVWERLKNLWRWSAIDPSQFTNTEPSASPLADFFKKKKATVVEMQDPLDSI
jgi:hypothetical protein